MLALVIGVVHVLFGSRFLLVTFDAEAAQVAGVKTRLWSICLNLAIGAVAAAAVHEVGALLTFALLTLAPMASLLVTRRIRTTFVVSAVSASPRCAADWCWRFSSTCRQDPSRSRSSHSPSSSRPSSAAGGTDWPTSEVARVLCIAGTVS